MRKNAYIPDMIQGVIDKLDQADIQQRTEAQIGCTINAVLQLTNLVEQLYQRIADLEKVQNERAD